MPPSKDFVARPIIERLLARIQPDANGCWICRVRLCCNPEHVEPVTQGENVRRGELASVNLSKTHCPKGHPYDDANTYFFGAKGYRGCRACRLDASRRHRARVEVTA